MKPWIVSSLDEEAIQGEETIQGRKLYEEIRYLEHQTFGRQVICPSELLNQHIL